ncbi:MAG: helix-turn-helix transcriptional regulator [Sedimentisphaerales bacterium]|nr:helix-turn-helix transcriptional regulator [Sedimentisphaerales bacterium]
MKSVNGSFDFSIVRSIRKSKGFKFDILAEKSGISRPTLYLIETGKNVPTLPTLNAIAQALDFSVMDLLQMAMVPEVEVRDLEKKVFSAGKTSNAVLACNEGVHCLCVKLSPDEKIPGDKVNDALKYLSYRVTCTVVEGKVLITISGKEYTLKKGQYICFNSCFRHTFEAIGGIARLVVVQSYCCQNSQEAIPAISEAEMADEAE